MDSRNEIKSRGRKHVKNKGKYKNKSKVEPKKGSKEENKSDSDSENEQYKTRSLKSNAGRYKEIVGDVDTGSTNFAILAQAPVSQGGHFQFKSDKTLYSEVEEKQLFKLDLNLICKSLSTIPITKRCGIPEEYFSEEQLQEIEKYTEKKNQEYNQYLLKLDQHPEEVSTSTPEEEKITQEENPQKEGDEKQNSKKLMDNMDVKEMKKEDLEEWLDDFLDS